MEEYLEYINSGDVGLQLAAEWHQKILDDPDYQFQENRNYVEDIIKQEIKKDKHCAKPEGEVFVRSWVIETLLGKKLLYDNNPEQQQKRAYKWWIDNEYFEFRRTWKPNKKLDELNFLWVTLNFEPTGDIVNCDLEVRRVTKLAIFKRCKITWAWEYYTAEGEHPHVHMLIELQRTGTIPFSEIVEKINANKKSRFAAYNEKVKFSWAREAKMRCWSRAVCIAYLHGQKIDAKVSSCEKDKQWRAAVGLEEIYHYENK